MKKPASRGSKNGKEREINLKALRNISYGVYVIGSRKEDQLNAQIANTVFQVTSEPPVIAVSINKQNLTHEFIKKSKFFTASALCRDTPLSFIGRFGFKSGRETNKLEGVNYKIGKTSAPVILENAVSYLEARVIQEVDVGTHTLFIGEVVDADIMMEKECLTYEYYQQVKRGSTPRTAAVYLEEKRVETVKAAKYKCGVCGYIYEPELGDPESGTKPGTAFEELPDNWVCPICGASKSDFVKIES